MDQVENQMGLFEISKNAKPAAVKNIVRKAAAKPAATQQKQPAAKQGAKGAKRVNAAPAKLSGLVPEGDVRLTANIRQDLHLKLKIAAAHKRTTIGEIIEDLIHRYVQRL